jgi:OFA family oxalate/formate antiporter-like MFS transporter
LSYLKSGGVLNLQNLNRGWLVVLAGVVINLAFGILYAWSVFSANLRSLNGWSSTEASLPYTVAIIMFAALMIPGGRLQDKLGPRKVITLAGILVGSGLILASFVPTVPGLVIAFGVLGGSGIGLGYSATTPAAVKWFSPSKKGFITGIVVGGFGLAPLYIAPLTTALINSMGIFNTFRVLGIAFGIIVVLLAQVVNNPEKPVAAAPGSAAAAPARDYTWKEMIRTPQFWQLWLMFVAGAMAGLMIIGHLKTISDLQSGAAFGATIVSLASIANAMGRPVAGVMSDKIGGGKTMMILYLAQGTSLLLFSKFTGFLTILLGAAAVTFGYGAMLAVYPSTVATFYGIKNFGLNYGVLFSAWGVGGVAGPILAANILDATGGYQTAFFVAATFCFIAAFLGFILKPVKN